MCCYFVNGSGLGLDHTSFMTHIVGRLGTWTVMMESCDFWPVFVLQPLHETFTPHAMPCLPSIWHFYLFIILTDLEFQSTVNCLMMENTISWWWWWWWRWAHFMVQAQGFQFSAWTHKMISLWPLTMTNVLRKTFMYNVLVFYFILFIFQCRGINYMGLDYSVFMCKSWPKVESKVYVYILLVHFGH